MARVTDLGAPPTPTERPLPERRAGLVGRLLGQTGTDAVLRIGTFLGLLLLWEGLSRVVRPIIFTSPGRAADAFREMIADGSLALAWSQTLFVLVTALSLAAVLGVALGILLGRFRTLSDLLEPEFAALFLTPRIALLPIIALWFGFGDPAKIVVVFLFSFFEIFFTVRNGVRTIDAEFVEVARAYCIPERTMLTKVIIPAALPYVATGLRLGLLHGMVGVVLVGFFLENNGIGGLLYYHGQDFSVSHLFAGLLTVMAVGMAMNQTLRWVERRVAPWRAGYGT
ncbi:MAG TPA: ABC transporter permease [Candidatus Limnocylindrales bacterium]|jgi:ABC-type nitrate/sulfonate/bicarbonate transport system permease component|nr:ABC transporter permease [Candidatus Limnocylindrales bacterium]